MVAFGLLIVFWSMLFFFLFVVWISLVIRVFIDIFRSDDLGGVAKVLWVVLVMALPMLGVLLYMILRNDQLDEHARRDSQRRNDAMRGYVQQAAAVKPASSADELNKLAHLRDQGVLSAEEFAAAKAKALG